MRHEPSSLCLPLLFVALCLACASGGASDPPGAPDGSDIGGLDFGPQAELAPDAPPLDATDSVTPPEGHELEAPDAPELPDGLDADGLDAAYELDTPNDVQEATPPLDADLSEAPIEAVEPAEVAEPSGEIVEVMEAVDGEVEDAEDGDALDAGCQSAGDCLGEPPDDCPGWWACTEGACAWQCPPPLDIWSRALLEDDEQLQVQVISEATESYEGALLMVRELRYQSYEWANGLQTPISIHAWLVRPMSGAAVKPALILLHSLEVAESLAPAKAWARRLGLVILSIDGPGRGGSLGTSPSTEPGVLFRASPSVRGSWIHAYALAASRGMTYLRVLAGQISTSRVGVMGDGWGGVVALVMGGVDARLKATLAREASGDILTGILQGSWLSLYLSLGGMTPQDAEVLTWAQVSDPLPYALLQRAPVMLVAGAQDEHHPLSSQVVTYEAITGVDKRWSLIANWDRYYYTNSYGQLESYNNAALAHDTLDDVALTWLKDQLQDDDAYGPLPAQPEVQRLDEGGQTRFVVACADALPDDAVARVFYSSDGAKTFSTVTLLPQEDGSFAKLEPINPAVYNDQNLVYFGQIELPMGAPDDDTSLRLTTSLRRPEVFVPVIRPRPY